MEIVYITKLKLTTPESVYISVGNIHLFFHLTCVVCDSISFFPYLFCSRFSLLYFSTCAFITITHTIHIFAPDYNLNAREALIFKMKYENAIYSVKLK